MAADALHQFGRRHYLQARLLRKLTQRFAKRLRRNTETMNIPYRRLVLSQARTCQDDPDEPQGNRTTSHARPLISLYVLRNSLLYACLVVIVLTALKTQ